MEIFSLYGRSLYGRRTVWYKINVVVFMLEYVTFIVVNRNYFLFFVYFRVEFFLEFEFFGVILIDAGGSPSQVPISANVSTEWSNVWGIAGDLISKGSKIVVWDLRIWGLMCVLVISRGRVWLLGAFRPLFPPRLKQNFGPKHSDPLNTPISQNSPPRAWRHL